MDLYQLFFELYDARNEDDVDNVIARYPSLFAQENRRPLGGNESNFGVVENQQSNPVAALVEKLTNSIDAILMRRCLELGIDPKSPDAPRSVEDAVETFFPDNQNWDLTDSLKVQAESIQLLADSYPGRGQDTSIIVYDDGEGQHPERFEDTFLSLLKGNKNEIHFVQGKYNMGGSGAIAFCGKKRYQLTASRRHDETGSFGFTLIRKHPLSAEESKVKKNTWYEYFTLNGQIPSFDIPPQGLDLRLHNDRAFHTGTIIKLYSYDVKGNRHLRRDMSRSLNEFLYEPALPIYVIENEERYPNDRVLTGIIFGLKRQLIDNDYVETTFSEGINDKQMGSVKVTIHVFKVRAKGKRPGETKKTVQNEYFKNNMAVLFSVNGQVHGHYTSEFITRTLKFNLLRDYLLIHVDCTDMHVNFRNELFMASRDRLKQGEESAYLRRTLGSYLSSGYLKEVYKRRKDNISVETAEDDSILKDFAENLPINPELRGLLSQTFRLDQFDETKRKRRPAKKPEPKKVEFNPKRFPSFFNLDMKKRGESPVITVPLNGSRTIQFDSDVESQYFDRIDAPGDLRIAVMTYTPNDNTGGTEKGTVNDISELFTVNRKSPQDGQIKIVFKPTEDVHVGDEIQVRVDLSSPAHLEGTFQQLFWVKITDPLPEKPEKVSVPEEEDKLGLPNYVLVFQSAGDDQENVITWESLEDNGIDMDYDVVVYPLLQDDVLETIYINMDSNVLKSYKAKIRRINPEQNQLADRRYISAIYFHTLFLYVINKKKRYQIYQETDGRIEGDNVPLEEYLRDLFASYYADFLLNFGTSELMEGLG